MKSTDFRTWSSYMILASLACGTSFAQVTSADVLGTVTDVNAAAISNARVTLVNLGTQDVRKAQTDRTGNYVINLLPPGLYCSWIEADGFRTFYVPSLDLSAGDRARLDARMRVGNVSESLEMISENPALQRDTSTISSMVRDQAVQDLPLNGRNFINLAQNTAGANAGSTGFGLASGTRPDDRRQTSEFSVNGQSAALNNEMIDGLDNNERLIATIGVKPSIDAIKEFRIQTNLFSADTTRAAGGAVNIVTKSGTNALHGSAYEFLRNDLLDARSYFVGAGTKPELRQNQFGGSVGGPIRKDRTFFFGDYEGFRQVSGKTFTSTVPTAFEQANLGNFSDVQVPGSTPGSCVAGPVVKPTTVGANYFRLFPAPTGSGSRTNCNGPGTPLTGVPVNNYVATLNTIQNGSTADARIDHKFNDSNSLFGRVTFNDVSTFTPGELPPVPGSVFGLSDVPLIYPGGRFDDFAGQTNQSALSLQVNMVRVLRPRLFLQLKAGYTRIETLSAPLNGDFQLNRKPQFLIPGADVLSNTVGLAMVYYPASPYAVIGDGIFLPLRYMNNTFQYSGALLNTRGAHNIKLGAVLIPRRAGSSQSSFPTGIWLGVIDPHISSMLTGGPFYVLRGNSLADPDYRTWEPGFYVQDDWHARSWLTLNLGLRYDIFTPFTEAHNNISNFDPATNKILVAGVNSSNTAGVPTDHKNIAPRLGFSADLGHRIVLRGGFGMTYFPMNYTSVAALKNPPFIGTFSGVTTFEAGLPPITPDSATNPSGSIAAQSLKFRTSYLKQYSLQLQKELGGNVFTLGYAGNVGRRLGQFIPNINMASGGANYNSRTNTPNVLPFPNLTQVQMLTSEGSSNYNALQATVVRRYKNGLTVDANYTWAHGVDDVTNIDHWGGTNWGYGTLINQIATYDRGNSDLVLRHRIAVSVNYRLPASKSLTGIPKLALSGWQVNLIETWQTALPFSVINAIPQSGMAGIENTGPGSSDRPNIAAGQSLTVADPSLGKWFNTSAFVAQASGAGNAGRNILFGPRESNLDFSLFKTLPVRETMNLQLRAEAFNLFNHPNFGTPNYRLGNPAFGSVSEMVGSYVPREIQFALKLLF